MTSAISQWASAGSRLVLSTSAGECVLVSPDGSPRSPETVAGVPAGAHQKISPDGRWLAYVTGQLPSFQIFVQSLQGPAGRWQISTSQAINPFWTRGGREIVYEGWDGQVMAVDIDTANGFHAGTPHPLFRLPARSFDVNLSSWVPDSSGDRFFLVLPPPVAQGAGTIELTTSFRSLVSRR
jgi:hypothetical protein